MLTTRSTLAHLTIEEFEIHLKHLQALFDLVSDEIIMLHLRLKQLEAAQQ